MGKNKRLRTASHASKPHLSKPSKPKPTSSNPSTSTSISQAEWKSKPTLSTLTQSAAQRSPPPTIPFTKHSRMLLVGEGDLSFAASLVRHHGVKDVTATVYESRAELEEKYPGVQGNIDIIENWKPEDNAEDAELNSNLQVDENGNGHKEEELKKNKDTIPSDFDNDEAEAFLSLRASEEITFLNRPRQGKVLFSIDVTRIKPMYDPVAKAAGKGKIGAFDVIQFMFPHCGGKSTDVNRQVRYNQELLISFFTNTLPSLAPRGRIIVTLFEGQPYELWCIKNLARHAGLAVLTSFAFQAKAYPGYQHVRTLGTLKARDGSVREGAWKGEDRRARSFVFGRRGEEGDGGDGGGGMGGGKGKGKKGKRKREEDEYTDGGESD